MNHIMAPRTDSISHENAYLIDLHMHTVASTHAYSTLHEYVNMAKLRGLALINITDHGPEIEDSPHIWHFGNLGILPRIIDGVIVLRSIEANILNVKGDIDCPKWLLDQYLDIVLAGFHEPACPPMGIDENTSAMIAAIESSNVHMITHPGNPKYPIHIEQVAKAAALHNVALELNNSSFICSRLGSESNCIKIAKAVKAAGGLLGLGSDSHVAYTVGELNHCNHLLDMIDFPRERVLNQSVPFLLDFIQKKTGKTILLDTARSGEKEQYRVSNLQN